MKVNPAESASTPEDEKLFSVSDASMRHGLDFFTTYSLIQREKLSATRTPWGEFVISENELDRVLEKPAPLITDRTKEE